AVIHEPSGFLSDADSAGYFVGTNSVLAVDHLPHCGQPLVQTKRAILEDGSGLCGELTGIVARAALPAVVLLKERDVLGTAARAFDAVWPAARYDVLTAVFRIGKVYDGFLKCAEYGFHGSIV